MSPKIPFNHLPMFLSGINMKAVDLQETELPLPEEDSVIPTVVDTRQRR